MLKSISEYRIVFTDYYPSGTHPSAMQGHYVLAHSVAEALDKVNYGSYTGRTKIHLWKSWDYKGSRISLPLPW